MTYYQDNPNPFLPPAPEDGQHDFGKEPADLGGNYRCTLCGAYRGSREHEQPCQGQWLESSKMRMRAREQWVATRLSEGGPLQPVVLLTTRQVIGVRTPGVMFGGETTYHALLACGHERELCYEEHEAVHWHKVYGAACVNERCPVLRREEFYTLNPSAPRGR